MNDSSKASWSPVVAVVAAFVMIFLLFPNPFRIPNNNPTASAEYAPVPGKDDSNEDSPLSELQQGSSAGIGAGGEGEGLLGGNPPPPPPPLFKPRQKHCIGNPPRQTEDPLSPPCVPFWNSDNGGATWKGVTANEIKIIMYNDWGISGDMTEPWKPTDEARQQDFNNAYIVRTVKAHLRYFQRRYQTYGRFVRVLAQKTQGSGAVTCQQRRGDAYATITADPPPFAAIHQGNAAGGCYVEELARYQIPSFGINWDAQRSAYYVRPGYTWGFYPDQEAESQYSAGFLCRSVVRGRARFAGTSLTRSLPRKVALIRPKEDSTGVFTRLADLLVKYAKDDCGFEFAKIENYYGDNGSGTASTIMQRLKDEGVTTIVCYCSAYPGAALTVMQAAATGQAYFPEWYLDQGSRGFRAIWQQRSTDPAQAEAFGVTHFWRGKAFTDQYHYRAYKEEEPDSVPNTRFNFDIYHMFLNLFEAIQAAGPNLTPETVEQGMFSFNYQDRANPFVPMGGYGPYGANALADYTFVDTGMAWWWDKEGTPPGGSRREGCLRVMHQGQRYYWHEWPKHDNALFVTGAPCSQDNTEITDPRPGDF